MVFAGQSPSTPTISFIVCDDTRIIIPSDVFCNERDSLCRRGLSSFGFVDLIPAAR